MAVEVASAYVSLIPSFSGGAARIASELGGPIGKSGRESGRRFGSVFATAALPPFRAFGAAALGFFAVDKIASFFTSAVTGASDLSEAGNKITTVFGSAAGQIDRFATSGATGLGQSKLAVLDAAATFGVYGKAAGLAGDENAKFSKELVGLSTDLASFYNTTPEEAIEAIGAALRGESEPIRRYGVLLDDATLRNEALRLGLIKTTKDALSPQQKVLAAHAAIMKQTKVAQGDFAKTSGGLANQQRILTAQWENLKATIGAGLLPALTKLATFANTDLIPGLSKLGGVAARVLGPVFEVAGRAITRLLDTLDHAGSGSGAGSGWLGGLAETGRTIQAAYAAAAPILRSLFASLQQAAATLAPAFQRLMAAIGGFVRALLPPLQSLGRQAMAVLGPALRQISQILATEVVPALSGFLNAARPIAVWFVQTFGPVVVAALGGVLQVVKGGLRILAGVFRTVTGLLKGDWAGAWSGIRQIATGTWTALKGLFAVFVNAGLVKVFRSGLTALTGLASRTWSGLKSLFSRGTTGIKTTVTAGLRTIVGWFAALPGRVLGVLASLGSRLVVFFTIAMHTALTAVTSAGARLLGWFRDLPGNILRGTANFGRVLISAGENLIRGLWDGLRRMARRMIAWFKSEVVERIRGLWPFSPAKWGPLRRYPMDEAGANLVRMLTTGIASEQPTLSDRMRQLAGIVTDTTPELNKTRRWGTHVRSLAPGPVAAAVPGGDSITVNAHAVDLDETRLAQVLYAARLRQRVARPR